MSEKQKNNARVYTTEKEQRKGMGARQMDDGMEMREMASRATRHHLKPMPMTHPPAVDPFPAPVMRGLWAGVLVGLLVGILFAALQLNGLLAIPGWEGLFSMTPITFYTFWAIMGAALFGTIIGIAAIQSMPVEHHANREAEGPED